MDDIGYCILYYHCELRGFSEASVFSVPAKIVLVLVVLFLRGAVCRFPAI